MFLKVLESTVNRILEMDEVCLRELGGLQGKSVAIELRGTDLRFQLLPGMEGVRLHGCFDGRSDVTVRGTPSSMLAYLAAGREGAPAADLEIAGDVELARRLQSIFRRLDPDWEEELSRWVGDTAARKLGNGFRSAASEGRQARISVARSFSEYLRYEKNCVPRRSEVDSFNSAVDALRDDVERLRVRLDRLGRRAGTGR